MDTCLYSFDPTLKIKLGSVLCAPSFSQLKEGQMKTQDKNLKTLHLAGRHLTSNKLFLLRDHTYWNR